MHTDTHRSTNVHHASTLCSTTLTTPHSQTHKTTPPSPRPHARSPRTHAQAPSRDPARRRGLRHPRLRSLVPAAPPSDARCRGLRRRWRWRFFLPGNYDCRTRTPIRVAAARARLASGPRVGPAEPARRGGWCRAAPGPPCAAASELRAAAGVRRAAGPAGPGARRCPPGRGEPGRAARGRGSAAADPWPGGDELAGFLRRVSGCSPCPSRRWGLARVWPALWPRPGRPPPGFVHSRPRSRSSLAALEMAGLPTSGAEAWIIWVWHGERVGSLPFLSLGWVCVTLRLQRIHISERRWEGETCVCTDT